MLDVSSENLLRSVFHTLAYADVFDYPLTAPEVYRYLTSTKAKLEEVTQVLSDSSLFSRVGEYFTLHGREEIVKTRERRFPPRSPLACGESHALWTNHCSTSLCADVCGLGSHLQITQTRAKMDYMIVTAPNHLWTCRALSLLVAFAKLGG
jgi:hypothetical protein